MSTQIVSLNVGGTIFMTTRETLAKSGDSLLADVTSSFPLRDEAGRPFLDRDPEMFRLILDYLRSDRLNLPRDFKDSRRLRAEAEHYGLTGLLSCLVASSRIGSASSSGGHERGGPAAVTVGYRGTFAFGRDGLADVKFRKLSRILVHGRGNICREVFEDSLNESRDPNHGGEDRYSSRYFLKHTALEQAFENLLAHGFTLVASCGSGTNSYGFNDNKPGQDSEEHKWQHYNEFIFVRS